VPDRIDDQDAPLAAAPSALIAKGAFLFGEALGEIIEVGRLDRQAAAHRLGPHVVAEDEVDTAARRPGPPAARNLGSVRALR
jgi:hypothetical protein